MKNIALWIACCGFLCSSAPGQSIIGIPAIKNFKNTDYHAAIEIRDITQDKNGILYFANDDGLLTYDGHYWKLNPLPNKAPVKSVAIDAEGKIYVGGQDEIGYFLPDPQGTLRYHSLKTLLPREAQQFADIWDILIRGNEVFFRTVESIFQLKNNALRTFDAPGGWRLIAKAGSNLFAEDKTEGLLIFKGEKWEAACGKTATADLHITGIMDYQKDSLLVSTSKNGLYLLVRESLIKKPTDIDPLLSRDLVNCAQKIDEDRYAIGTKSSGVFIIDRGGKLIQRFSNIEGLPNNNILRTAMDQDKNLWLGLENGVSAVRYRSPIKHLYPVRENQIMSNAIALFDHRLFIGTSNGLYSARLDSSKKDFSTASGSFTEVKGTKGRVWSLREINHQLLLGHEDGAFIIREGNAFPISTGQGVWGFSSLFSSPDIIAGTYTGLRLISYAKDHLISKGRINDLYESLGFLTVDERNGIWASHPYRGIFKSTLPGNGETKAAYRHYTGKEGLPSTINDYVYLIKNKIVAATEEGVYDYDPATDRFKPSAFFKPVFRNSPVEYLKEDGNGNIWFVSNERVGVIDFRKPSGQKSYSVICFPELTAQTVKGFAEIYPYNDENIFIGSNNGVIHLNYSQYIKTVSGLQVILSTVKAIAEKDSLIFGGYPPKENQAVKLSNHWNSFHFEYSSPVYAQSNVEYSYKLEGFDKAASDWSVKTEKDYTNLPAGNYIFSVRARNNLSTISRPVVFPFTVEPAWYQTFWAYLIYFLLLVCAVWLFIKWERRRFARHQEKHEEEQKRLNYLYSLELDSKEKGIIALQNEKLAAVLDFKNKELATATMHLVERGGLLLNIKEELVSVIKKLNIPELSHEFKSVFRMMGDTEKNDQDWNGFAIHFDQVHNNFLSTLKTKFPNLSSTDLKLCAYLRLNLSSKEIAQLLNISLKGVEISRYRIRKKFQLTREVNLYDFLIDIAQ
jgi:ligand-binding sensor domain-containing protein/DNA-binding CsgD family transcriptional regulator